MKAFVFYAPYMLLWLWTVPVIVGLYIRAGVRRQKALEAFGSDRRMISRKRESVLNTLAITLLILGLARPAWDLEEQAMQETGRDVIFLLDVSRSMLAEDLHPNRLENARNAILDCVEDLSGDRVALGLFAGSAGIRCPLTVDYDYFRMALRQASPESMAAGGTAISPAIEKVLDKLVDPEKKGLQDLILITDGGDQIEGPDEVQAVKELEAAGVRFIAIGLGDRSRGSRIAVEAESGQRSFMKHGNKEVWTRLQSETLRRMAAAVPNGIYFDVGNGPFDLSMIYGQIMENAERSGTASQTMERYQEKFHFFLFGSVVCLLLSHRWRNIG